MALGSGPVGLGRVRAVDAELARPGGCCLWTSGRIAYTAAISPAPTRKMIKPLSILRNKSSSWRQMVRRGRGLEYATFVDTYAPSTLGAVFRLIVDRQSIRKTLRIRGQRYLQSSVLRWRFRRVGSWSGEML